MTDHEQIIEVENLLMAAIKSNSKGSLEKLVLSELAFIDKNGQVFRNPDALESNRLEAMFTPNVAMYDKQINLTGNTALVILVERSKGKYGPLPFNGKLRYMRIWRKIGNDWKMAAAS